MGAARLSGSAAGACGLAKEPTTRPSRPSRRTPTTPWPALASWIRRSTRSSSSKLPSVPSSGSAAAPARLAASACPRSRTSASSARRSCCVATSASAMHAVASTVTISALNLTWRERKPPPPARGGRRPGLLETDVEDLELPGALRDVHRHAVADLLAQQRARHRRGHRDPPLRDVGLLLAQDLVGDALAAVHVLEVDRHPETHLVRRLAGGVDHLGARETVLEQADAPLEVALPLLGRVELRVLGDVAVRPRGLDLAHDARALDALQVAELLLELLVARARHGETLRQRLPILPSALHSQNAKTGVSRRTPASPPERNRPRGRGQRSRR